MGAHPYLSWNIVSWSVGAEWWTYMLAPFILLAIARLTLLVNWVIASISICGLAYISITYSDSNLDMTYDLGYLRCICEFTIGVVVYRAYNAGSMKEILQRDSLFCSLFVGLIIGFHFHINDLVFVPLFALIVLCAAHNRSRVMLVLESFIPHYLGKISYSIYMMYGLVSFIFWYGFPYLTSKHQVTQLGGGEKAAVLVTFIGLTLLLSHLMYIYIEVRCRYWLDSSLIRYSALARPNEAR